MDTIIFSAVTTGILALAASLAYLVQRARYLREIEPDLKLKWPNRIRVIEMSTTLKEFWAFYIDIEVENVSRNHAEDLRYEVDLQIFPQRGKARFLREKIHDAVRIHPTDVLAGRKIIIPVYSGSNVARDLQEQLDSWDGSMNVGGTGFMTTVIISYSSKRELLLWFLIPWKLGRVKYTREISGSWGFQVDEKVIHPHISLPWQFPKKSLGSH